MSQYLESLSPGTEVHFEGPKGRLTYLGYGEFKIGKEIRHKTKIGCVAGGTGISPVYQVI